MNRLILLLLLSLGINYASAGNYKVLYVNDASLKFNNGKAIKVGDSFKEASDIVWSKEKQAIKVFDLTAKKQIIIYSVEKMNKTGFEALIGSKQMSTHDAAGLPDDQKTLFDGMFDEEYLLLDPIEIPVDKRIDLENHHFEASYDYGDTRLIKPLKTDGDKLILDKTVFEVDGEKLEPRDITIKIDYVDNEDFMKTSNVGDKIQVIFIPDVLE